MDSISGKSHRNKVESTENELEVDEDLMEPAIDTCEVLHFQVTIRCLFFLYQAYSFLIEHHNCIIVPQYPQPIMGYLSQVSYVL